MCFVTGAVCCSIVGHGCLLGFPGVLLPQLHAPDSWLTITKDEESWITSIMAASVIVGSFVTPPIMGRSGRRIAHLAVSAPALLGWFVTVLARSFVSLFIGRVLLGLSFGMLLPLRSVLIGEYTSPRNRGAFLTTVSLSQAFGIFFVHLIGTLTTWDVTALICTFFPFMSIILTIYSPESPTFLALKGKYEECRTVFHWLRGDTEESELEDMIKARIVSEQMEAKPTNFRSIIETVKEKEFYKPVLLMVQVQMMMQFAGGTTFSNYSTVIIGLIVGSSVNVKFWMIFLDGQRIVLNIIAMYVINKCKRRTMMFSTGGLCVLVHLAISLYVYAKNNGLLMYNATWLPLLLINIQFFTLATGMVPLPGVISGEVLPLRYKGIGGIISIIAMSATIFFVLKTFPKMVSGLGIEGTYLIYSIAMFFSLIVIWFLLPETRGKTLLQIEEEFRGKKLNPEEVEVRKSLTGIDRKLSIISAHSNVVIET